MDHRYIDDHRVADRYLDNALSTPERLNFEAHLVDCQECADRLLLAEMFHHRNGGSHRAASRPSGDPAPTAPVESVTPAEAVLPPEDPVETSRTGNLRLVFRNRRFWPWQLLLLLAGAAAVVVLAASALVLLLSRR